MNINCSAPTHEAIPIEFEEHEMGGDAIDKYGTTLPDKTFEACKSCDAIFFGSVGGPKWTGAKEPHKRPEWGLLHLRKELQLYCNIRPTFFPSKSLYKLSSLKEEIVKDVSFIVLRENAGGSYYGERKEDDGFEAYDTCHYTVPEIERITRAAAQLALQHSPPWPVINVDKYNVMASSRLWRRVFNETMAREFPQLETKHFLIDAACLIMLKNPRAFNGVVVTDNMFGDILSDEASGIPGSLGLAPSASTNGIGDIGVALYEPVHGTGPDIAGKNMANPIASILSAAMLVRYSLKLPREADAIEDAVRYVLDDVHEGGLALRTPDLWGKNTTGEVGEAVVRAVRERLARLLRDDGGGDGGAGTGGSEPRRDAKRAWYCDKECQVKDFRAGHKEICRDIAMILGILELPELAEMHDLYLHLRRDELKRKLVQTVQEHKVDGRLLTLLTQVWSSGHKSERVSEEGTIPAAFSSIPLSPCAQDHPQTLSSLTEEQLSAEYPLPCPVPPIAGLDQRKKPLRDLLVETECGHGKEEHPPAKFFYRWVGGRRMGQSDHSRIVTVVWPSQEERGRGPKVREAGGLGQAHEAGLEEHGVGQGEGEHGVEEVGVGREDGAEQGGAGRDMGGQGWSGGGEGGQSGGGFVGFVGEEEEHGGEEEDL
ncbi:3-isopropylmalate dehydrogenase [Gonapodya sp. JEL0774]|nr:3-isopropylmalate dehydrogenase [Gonapodya sp. JEL0774]